jgi:hypothetical protein
MRLIVSPKQLLISLLVLLSALLAGACSAFQPPDANGPRSNRSPYPVVFPDETTRQEESLLAWRQLTQRYGLADKTAPDLQPITGTLRSLPATLNGSIFLPKVGAGPSFNEEEIREALRRFIDEWRVIIGADPAQLSLVERTDEPDGNKVARYEQRPFRYPLRGGYGNLVIRFASNLRVLELSSNCLPNTDRLQAALANITPKLTAEDALNHIKGHSITLTDASGKQQTFTLGATDPVTVRQLVVYVLPPGNQSTSLEFHLAWEIETPNSPFKTVYLDAVDDRVIAGT